MELDPERFRARVQNMIGRRDTRVERGQRATRRFLRGPIPLDWLVAAAHLSGKATVVAVVLWFLAGCNRGSTVTLSRRILNEFGVGRNASSRALHLLERANLVRVDRRRGRCPRVTISSQNRKRPDGP